MTTSWVPEACTLPTAERLPRRAEFDDLFASATDVERRGPRWLRITLAGDQDLAQRVRDLAARESACCAFFTFTVTPEPPERVVFDIEVPAGQVDVLDALAARAAR
jgi:hypothetical protein